MHIELRLSFIFKTFIKKNRKWAHVFIIAPLSANTMAKLVNGLCDNLLTCIFRAWNF